MLVPWLRLMPETDIEYQALTQSSMEYRTSLDDVQAGDVLLPRFTIIPYTGLVYNEVSLRGAHMCHSIESHQLTLDAAAWADILIGLTPAVYTDLDTLAEGAYVLKGNYNSRKFQWNTHMYAPNCDMVQVVAERLRADVLIGRQTIIARPYVPLMTLSIGDNGLPITNEWRTFWWLGDDIVHLGSGAYWTQQPNGQLPFAAYTKCVEAATRLAAHTDLRFICLDVAEAQTGEWTIIELNDGQMSGLCSIDAGEFYQQVTHVVT